MKFPILTVKVSLPDGSKRDYSTADLVRHMATNGREFCKGREADKVRQGARLIAAFAGAMKDSLEVSDDDARALKAATENPSQGWSVIPVTMSIQAGVNADKTPVMREQQRLVVASALELLPLIDGIANA